MECLSNIPLDDVNDVFDQKVDMLALCLEAIDGKFKSLSSHVSMFEDDFVHAEEVVSRLRNETETGRGKQQLLNEKVRHLERYLERQKLESSYCELKLQQQLAEERLRAERARAHRDEALQQRNTALSELATAYADMDAMQTTISDSAFYVRYMRKRLLEMEAQTAVLQQQVAAATARSGGADAGNLSYASIKAAVGQAVRDAADCDQDERKKRMRQLQLRWHPDKNPILTGLATEVTKMINEAMIELDAGGPGRKL